MTPEDKVKIRSLFERVEMGIERQEESQKGIEEAIKGALAFYRKFPEAFTEQDKEYIREKEEYLNSEKMGTFKQKRQLDKLKERLDSLDDD